MFDILSMVIVMAAELFLNPNQWPVWLIAVTILIAIFELIMKGLGLWRSARNKHTVWYVLIFIFNTAGILPLIYLLLYKENGAKKKK